MDRNEIKAGVILADSWNGMADYFEVQAVKGNNVVLREVEWGCCEAPVGQEADPCHRWTSLKFDDNGNPVYANDKIITKRMMKSKKYADKVYITGITYTGTRLWVVDDPHKKTEMYWG